MVIYIVIFLISISAIILISYVTAYAFDDQDIFAKNEDGYGDELRVFMPKLSDLEFHTDIDRERTQQRYVDMVILPSHDYFILRNQLSENKLLGTEVLFYRTIILIPFLLILWRSILNIGLTSSKVFSFLISICICIFSYLLVSSFYQKNKSIPPFRYTNKSLEVEFDDNGRTNYDGFDLPYDKALNNFKIDKHNFYLWSIKEDVMKRKRTRNIVETIGGILYLVIILFFYNP